MVEEYKTGMKEIHERNSKARADGRPEIPITLGRGGKGQYTLKELWDKWIESLTQEVMKSKDLLAGC